MKRHTKVLGGAILLAGTLLAQAVPAQIRRADNKETERDSTTREQLATPVTEIFFCEVATTECRSTGSEFNVSKLRDLFVFVTWPGASGDMVQTVEFFLPNGSLYMKRDTPFRARIGQARARAVPGAAPFPEAFLTSSRGEPTVVTHLPVAGTHITQRNLLGLWTVRVSLGGKPVQSAQFTLKAPVQP